MTFITGENWTTLFDFTKTNVTEIEQGRVGAKNTERVDP